MLSASVDHAKSESRYLLFTSDTARPRRTRLNSRASRRDDRTYFWPVVIWIRRSLRCCQLDRGPRCSLIRRSTGLYLLVAVNLPFTVCESEWVLQVSSSRCVHIAELHWRVIERADDLGPQYFDRRVERLSLSSIQWGLSHTLFWGRGRIGVIRYLAEPGSSS